MPKLSIFGNAFHTSAPKTIKKEFQKKTYKQFLSDCTEGQFGGFVIEAYYDGPVIEKFTRQFPTVIETCSQLLQICQISYYIEEDKFDFPRMRFVCYINHENYNVRVFSEMLKQLLYNNTDDTRYNLFYASTSDNPKEVAGDIDFIRQMPDYSLIFGYDKKIRSFFFRDCEISDYHMDPLPFVEAMESGRFESAMDELIRAKETFLSYIHTNMRCSYKDAYSYIQTVFETLKKTYANPEQPGTSYPMDLNAYLISYEDASEFIGALGEELEDYANKYPGNLQAAQESDLINAVLKYIEDNIGDVTLQTAASQFNVSYAHLSRLFKKNTDQNFSEYVSEKKLQIAAKFLEEGNKTIAQITADLGYHSSSYFLTKFKEKYKMTPSTYQRTYFINRK